MTTKRKIKVAVLNGDVSPDEAIPVDIEELWDTGPPLEPVAVPPRGKPAVRQPKPPKPVGGRI